MRRSAERLNRLRYFSAIDSELIPTDRPDEVDLKIKVKEDNTGALMGGIGYSTYYDVGVTASIMERNLFGRGYQVQLQGLLLLASYVGRVLLHQPARLRYRPVLRQRHLLHLRLLGRLHQRKPSVTPSALVIPSVNIRPWVSATAWNATTSMTWMPMLRPTSPTTKGTNWTSAISARILRDTTDDRARPTKGHHRPSVGRIRRRRPGRYRQLHQGRGRLAGLLVHQSRKHLPPARPRGRVFQNTSSRVPVFERFWLGGMDTVRGYSYSDLSPTATTSTATGSVDMKEKKRAPMTKSRIRSKSSSYEITTRTSEAPAAAQHRRYRNLSCEGSGTEKPLTQQHRKPVFTKVCMEKMTLSSLR